jgi:hypothetical protein
MKNDYVFQKEVPLANIQIFVLKYKCINKTRREIDKTTIKIKGNNVCIIFVYWYFLDKILI